MKLIMVLDIETTGFDPYSDMICEIGIVLLDLNSGSIKPSFNRVIFEDNKYIDRNCWIFKNSNLSYEHVRNRGMSLETIGPILQSIFNLNIPTTSFNQTFDFGFLEQRGFIISNRFWDPMIKLTPILKILRYNGSYKWPSVQEAWDFFYPNIHYKEKHRALDDAIHEAKIIYKTNQYLKKKISGEENRIF